MTLFVLEQYGDWNSSRAVLHDSVEYPDPNIFNPDRFIRDGALNSEIRSSTINFGVGRR